MTLCCLTAAVTRADDLTQSLRVSPDGHFLAQPDDEPFFERAAHYGIRLAIVTAWQFYDPARNVTDPPALPDMPPWRKALERATAGQMGHLKQLMLSRPYFSRIPDQSLIVGAAGEGSEHISATRDKAGRYAMVYLPQGQTVTVNLTGISGLRAVAWWFDPRNAAATRIQGDFPTTGTRLFTPPSHGAGEDWVLVIDDSAQEFGPPAGADAHVRNTTQRSGS